MGAGYFLSSILERHQGTLPYSGVFCKNIAEKSPLFQGVIDRNVGMLGEAGEPPVRHVLLGALSEGSFEDSHHVGLDIERGKGEWTPPHEVDHVPVREQEVEGCRVPDKYR